MKMVPLKQFICDKCGELIKSPEDGWLQWLDIDPETGRNVDNNFIIVHHMPASPLGGNYGCYHRSQHISDMHLEYFLGHNGLVHLLSLFDSKLNETKELIEIIRRLHIPHYEEARIYWKTATNDGFLDEADSEWPYLQDNLLEIINRYGS